VKGRRLREIRVNCMCTLEEPEEDNSKLKDNKKLNNSEKDNV
jgi:hypothetical protein